MLRAAIPKNVCGQKKNFVVLRSLLAALPLFGVEIRRYADWSA